MRLMPPGAWLMAALGLSWVSAASSQTLRGVNFSGAELAGDKLPGRPGYDYIYPDATQLDWAAAMGFTVIRLPVLWERLQPAPAGPLDPAELARVQSTITAAAQRGIDTIIDVHNYGDYHRRPIGSPETPPALFTDLWRRMARAFLTQPHAIFGLMNEPQGIGPAAWSPIVQAAIDKIRQTGARNLILVPGAGWDGAHDFVTPQGAGPSNATALAALHDPADRIAFEVHQYLDADYSGTHPDCPAAGHADALLEPVTAWLKAGKRRGFLGEFAASARPDCLAGLNRMLGHMAANSDVWAGWTAWAAGPWWSADYPFGLQPRNGVTPAQTALLSDQAKSPR